ncbi:Coenzyme F420 hydrogenase/dehydrogenase, beta subunit C-terminal domain [Isoptericola sp. b490]|uniref:Coenzyme F420 hydrogenase/dehydrogenase, beta subunit C-terminal domain n=1 Tax=Actinotalea lenta TaxID=3064654 RepID=UPI002713B49A|nr:Coenzyme F420 hydrogenase/dehydrogenase, beta subunit C-terminal domain [Isoptericola sp. b490]MDO8121486.1 Coenzyme F420 hydrogenase/dehydrogenase, beta subunit C-terminal domain [Isoptericola sp. b490]
MELDQGQLRPRRTGPPPARVDARRFRAVCPGVHVDAARPVGSRRHATLGPVVGSWRAWATDPEIRRSGSSGGVLTALASWLTESGEAVRVVGAAAAPDPRRTMSVTITDRTSALRAAGSRYAPVATAAAPAVLAQGSAVVAKPCEASALRALSGSQGPLLMSFFCAGTPNQAATDGLVTDLGLPATAPLARLRYRGHGWPGRFVATAQDGTEVDASYHDSWGKALGPTVQWRCKICPDGVGEASDITAGDLWTSDERGYPVFSESPGVSALVARTERGADVIRRAVAAGVLVAEPVDPETVAAVQPLHRRRRARLLGRLAGARLAGRRTPRYRGFGLTRLALAEWRDTVRTARGSFSRVRAVRRSTG